MGTSLGLPSTSIETRCNRYIVASRVFILEIRNHGYRLTAQGDRLPLERKAMESGFRCWLKIDNIV